MNFEKMIFAAEFPEDINNKFIVYLDFLTIDKTSKLPQLTVKLNNHACSLAMLNMGVDDIELLEKAVADFYEENVQDSSYLSLGFIDKDYKLFELTREIEKAKQQIYRYTQGFAGNTILVNPQSMYYHLIKEIPNIGNIVESYYVNPESLFVLHLGEDMMTFPAVCYYKKYHIIHPASDREIDPVKFHIEMLNPQLIRKISLLRDLSE